MNRPDTLCPNCLRTAPITSRAQTENGDVEMVKCPDCGWETDRYEAMKCADGHLPRCFVDSRPAIYFSPVRRRFFCVACGPRVGLGDVNLMGGQGGQGE